LGIDVHGFTEEDFDIFLVTEDGAEGGGDFSGRERAGGYLVEEWLEEVEVAFVEEGDVGVSAVEGLGGHEARETSSQDEDAMWRRHGGFLLLFGQRLISSLRALGTIISKT